MKSGNDTWLMAYGDGSTLSGELYIDVVGVSGVTFEKQAVEVTELIPEGLQGSPHSKNYLGLGHKSGNQGKRMILGYPKRPYRQDPKFFR